MIRVLKSTVNKPFEKGRYVYAGELFITPFNSEGGKEFQAYNRRLAATISSEEFNERELIEVPTSLPEVDSIPSDDAYLELARKAVSNMGLDYCVKENDKANTHQLLQHAWELMADGLGENRALEGLLEEFNMWVRTRNEDLERESTEFAWVVTLDGAMADSLIENEMEDSLDKERKVEAYLLHQAVVEAQEAALTYKSPAEWFATCVDDPKEDWELRFIVRRLSRS